MKKFTELLESYKEINLKALSQIVEEPTEDEFNAELETAKKQAEGKIKKKIAKASVQAVEIQKEEIDLNEDGIGPLGYYVHHNKTGKMTLHSNRKSASNASNKHDVAHGAIVSASGAYYKDGNNNEYAKKALAMHMEKGIKEEIELEESDEFPSKLHGKPSKDYLKSGNNTTVQTPEDKLKRLKDLRQSAKEIKGKNLTMRDGKVCACDEETEHNGEPKGNYKIYHDTYSSAVQHGVAHTKGQGYHVPDEEIDNKIAMGDAKPKTGNTNIFSLRLHKDGKPSKKYLHMQVYNNGNKYELNKYVS